MKNFNCLNSKQIRLLKAIPLIFGLVSIMEAPNAGAVTGAIAVKGVNIIQGYFDVDRNGVIDGNDNLNNVLLWFDGAAPVRLDIKGGEVDVNEDININAQDDLNNVDLNDENDVGPSLGVPSNNRTDIRDGAVDVDEDGIIHEIGDALRNVQLFYLLP